MKILAFLSVFFLGSSAFGQLSQEAASTVTGQINGLMGDYTDTVVTPSTGTDGVIVISTKALTAEKVAKLWTFLSAAAIGKYFNDNPKLAMKEIWFSDVTDLKARPIRYSVLQVDLAKSLQAKVYAGTMNLEEAQTKVWNSLVKKTKEASK